MIADTNAPKGGIGELDSARRPRLERQGEDGTAESDSVTRWKASELTLGGGRKLDPMFAPAHSSSGPYLA
jgi:hypothetical protein